jgi:ABC-type nitrate/sulfonate/bicarbonate transport system ATPase subunit
VGRSGVGKSTLLSCIAGMQGAGLPTVERYRGTIQVDDADPLSIRGPKNVSWVPQVPALLRHMTVLDNIALPLTLTGTGDEQSVRRAAFDLLDKLGLSDLWAAYPRQLSGGESTRVSVARALVSEPKYLYLDEPFSGLDLPNRWIIYELIRRLRARDGFATVVTSHNIPEAVLLADRIIEVRRYEGRTEAEVVENVPALTPGDEPAGCLDKARMGAAALEKAVFFSKK